MTKEEFIGICDEQMDVIGFGKFVRMPDRLPEWPYVVTYLSPNSAIEFSYENRGFEHAVVVYPTPDISGHSVEFNRFFLRVNAYQIDRTLGRLVPNLQSDHLKFPLTFGDIENTFRGIALSLSTRGDDFLHGDFSRFAIVKGPGDMPKLPAMLKQEQDVLLDGRTLTLVGRYSSLQLGGMWPVYRLTLDVADDGQTFSGKISDIGPGGGASLTGSIDEAGVHFDAKYFAPSSGTVACTVHFDGITYEYGNAMRGYWTFLDGYFKGFSGTWKADIEGSQLAEKEGFVWPPRRRR